MAFSGGDGCNPRAQTGNVNGSIAQFISSTSERSKISESPASDCTALGERAGVVSSGGDGYNPGVHAGSVNGSVSVVIRFISKLSIIIASPAFDRTVLGECTGMVFFRGDGCNPGTEA